MVPPNQTFTDRRAFTLMELLTVVAIVCLLFALLFPSFGAMMEKSKQETCANNLRHIVRAEILYSQDNNGLIIQTTAGGRAWTENLASYVEKTIKYDNSRVTGIFACPKGKMKSQGGAYADYGHNGYANGADSDPNTNPGDWGNSPPHHMFLTSVGVAQPSKVLLFGDAATQALDPSIGPSTATGYSANWGIVFRHGADRSGLNGRANLAFLDGHVESRKLSEMPTTGSFWMNYPWNPTP
ncbi:DUF1559 domain-containing protein [soil metagenome]